jgi:hypothetical protein
MNKSHQVPNAKRGFFIGQTPITKQVLSGSKPTSLRAVRDIQENNNTHSTIVRVIRAHTGGRQPKYSKGNLRR